MSSYVVDIRDLRITFPGYRGRVEAVRGVSLQVSQGEIVGLVGESGSGKSVTAMTALGLSPMGTAPEISGVVEVLGQDMLSLSDRELESIRGSQISMVPQEPMTSLNPTMRIGRQLAAVIQAHGNESKRRAGDIAAGLLADMLIEDPRRVMGAYPFELSGGLRQRVLLAMAFSCNPRIIIADEPTSALDVTAQKQVLDLLAERARATAASVLLISHDMGVVRYACERINVMYRGEIVESGSCERVLDDPGHPYTVRLLNALPERSPRRQPLPVDLDPVTS